MLFLKTIIKKQVKTIKDIYPKRSYFMFPTFFSFLNTNSFQTCP